MLKQSYAKPRNGSRTKRFGKIAELGLSGEEMAYLQEAKADDEWLNNRPAEFWKKYANRYVAVRNQQVVAHSKSMRILQKKLQGRHIRFITISYIEDPSQTIIYAL